MALQAASTHARQEVPRSRASRPSPAPSEAVQNELVYCSFAQSSDAAARCRTMLRGLYLYSPPMCFPFFPPQVFLLRVQETKKRPGILKALGQSLETVQGLAQTARSVASWGLSHMSLTQWLDTTRADPAGLTQPTGLARAPAAAHTMRLRNGVVAGDIDAVGANSVRSGQ
uniref:Uncharacterized protein n=1 Tax=Chrysotila carterae TaxID=13221 RepID=A0A7S4ESY6_CHRCT